MFEVGRICMKTAGREAGKYCVIVKSLEDNFVLVTGPRDVTNVKRRKCNMDHLEPVMEKIKISADATDDAVIKAYEEADIFSKLKLSLPSPEKLKETRDRRQQKIEKMKEEEKAMHQGKETEAKQEKSMETVKPKRTNPRTGEQVLE